MLLVFLFLFIQFTLSQISFIVEIKQKDKIGSNNMASILREADVSTLGEPKSVLKNYNEPIVKVNFIPGVCTPGYFWENNKCNLCPCTPTVSNVTVIRFAQFVQI